MTCHVVLEVQPEGKEKHLKITVADIGWGIPPEILPYAPTSSLAQDYPKKHLDYFMVRTTFSSQKPERNKK